MDAPLRQPLLETSGTCCKDGFLLAEGGGAALQSAHHSSVLARLDGGLRWMQGVLAQHCLELERRLLRKLRSPISRGVVLILCIEARGDSGVHAQAYFWMNCQIHSFILYYWCMHTSRTCSSSSVSLPMCSEHRREGCRVRCGTRCFPCRVLGRNTPPCSTQTNGSGGVCPERLSQRQCDLECRSGLCFHRAVRVLRHFFAP